MIKFAVIAGIIILVLFIIALYFCCIASGRHRDEDEYLDWYWSIHDLDSNKYEDDDDDDDLDDEDDDSDEYFDEYFDDEFI